LGQCAQNQIKSFYCHTTINTSATVGEILGCSSEQHSSHDTMGRVTIYSKHQIYRSNAHNYSVPYNKTTYNRYTYDTNYICNIQ